MKSSVEFRLKALLERQSLAFMVVGRKITVHVRGMLFKRIVVQDIAFFDGFRTGDLTQRLSGDVRAMVSPLQYTFSTFLSNTVLLIGGVVMCFYTSWRLSMLAFTTVLPIMHVTESYAKGPPLADMYPQQSNEEYQQRPPNFN